MFIKFYFLALLYGVFGDNRPKITVTFGNGTTINIGHSALLNVSEDVVGPVKLICTAEHSITWKTKALSENMRNPSKLILEPSLLNDAIEPRYTQVTAIKSFGKLTKFHSALYICQPEGEGSFYNTAYLKLVVIPSDTPPEISLKFANGSVIYFNESSPMFHIPTDVGVPVELACTAHYPIFITLEGLKRDKITGQDNDDSQTKLQYSEPNHSMFKITFKQLLPSHSGIYLCANINGVGPQAKVYLNFTTPISSGTAERRKPNVGVYLLLLFLYFTSALLK
ncbi:Fibroblast growth factor receptor-like 1, partial [Orchesella cincta]